MTKTVTTSWFVRGLVRFHIVYVPWKADRFEESYLVIRYPFPICQKDTKNKSINANLISSISIVQIKSIQLPTNQIENVVMLPNYFLPIKLIVGWKLQIIMRRSEECQILQARRNKQVVVLSGLNLISCFKFIQKSPFWKQNSELLASHMLAQNQNNHFSQNKKVCSLVLPSPPLNMF